jgi:hypothetical protein
VKPGLLSEDWGRFYDRLFHDRQQGDYAEFVSFDPGEVREMVERTPDLIHALEALAGSKRKASRRRA